MVGLWVGLANGPCSPARSILGPDFVSGPCNGLGGEISLPLFSFY